MSEAGRLRLLALALRVFGLTLFLIFTVLFVLTATGSPLVGDGGALVWMRWKPFSVHVELMLYAVYWVWAIFLLRAAREPLRYATFLDFTAWASLAHGLVMLASTFIAEGHLHKLYTDDLLTLLLAATIFVLRPRAAAELTRTLA